MKDYLKPFGIILSAFFLFLSFDGLSKSQMCLAIAAYILMVTLFYKPNKH